MVEIELFSYEKGQSRLHRTHPTLKILLLSIISFSITYSSSLYLFYYLILILIGFYTSGLKKNFRELKYIIYIAISLLFFQIVLIKDFSFESILNNTLYILRISEILIMGRLFTATTKPDDITPGIYNIIRNKKIAENISLTIRLIPTFLISWREVEETLNSRGLYLRKNPIYLLKKMAIPMFVETFKKADSISIAMESRYYNGWIKQSVSAKKIDYIIIILVVLPHLQRIKMLLPQG